MTDDGETTANATADLPFIDELRGTVSMASLSVSFFLGLCVCVCMYGRAPPSLAETLDLDPLPGRN